MKPSVKIIAVSNVYSRIMNFSKKGDCEVGHKHTYDHATLVSSGAVLYEVLDDSHNVTSSKTFVAPSVVFVDKDKLHRITALLDDTVCACIHALRTMDGDIVDPEFLIEPTKNEKDLFDKVSNQADTWSLAPFTKKV